MLVPGRLLFWIAAEVVSQEKQLHKSLLPACALKRNEMPAASADGFLSESDVELGVAASDNIDPKYVQHFDKEVVIPDRIARPCLVSAQLFLALTVVSFVRGYFLLGAFAALLYATTINHWRAPRMTSWRHTADLLAVVSTAAYGCYLAATKAKTSAWIAIWFTGLGTVAICFACNEITYFYQVIGEKRSCFCAKWTAPGTEERERAYHRAMWTHFISVHVLSAALALALVLRGLEPP